ncbi:MAG: hypothetical protein ACKV2O_21330 [Acidimicrobiales bacterium]
MAHTRHVLKDLDQEWAALAASPGAARQLRLWRADHGCFADIGSLGELIEVIRHGEFDVSNDLVWSLLELAVHDALAVRTVLQALIPGLGGELGWLLAWAGRTDHGLLDEGDVDQMLVVAVMEAIRHAAGKRRAWPLSSILRRTHRVLRRDVLEEERWRATMMVTDCPEAQDIESPESTAGEVLAEVLTDARRDGTMSSGDVELVWLTRIGGYQPAELADRFGVNGDCLRRRRQRAEARLIAMAEAG